MTSQDCFNLGRIYRELLADHLTNVNNDWHCEETVGNVCKQYRIEVPELLNDCHFFEKTQKTVEDFLKIAPPDSILEFTKGFFDYE